MDWAQMRGVCIVESMALSLKTYTLKLDWASDSNSEVLLPTGYLVT